MTAEAGHAPNRAFFDQSGNINLNGAKLYDAKANDLSTLLNFGGDAGALLPQGNIYRYADTTGTGLGGSNNAQFVLASFSLPAGSLTANGQLLTVTAQGNTGANGNHKRMQIIWNPSTAVVGSAVGSGGTVIADTGDTTTNTNNTGWMLSGTVARGANANTQVCATNLIGYGTVNGGVGQVQTAAANEAGAILVAITGSSNANNSDVTLFLAEINACN